LVVQTGRPIPKSLVSQITAAEVIALRVCRNLLIAVWLPDKASVIELLKGENDSGRNSYPLTAFLQRQPTMLLDSRRVPFQKPGRIGQSAFSASSFYLNISPP
jgi:hypothetical protein